MSDSSKIDDGGAACGCIARVNEAMADRNARVMLPWFGPQRPFIETMKVDEKKRGKPPRLFASFCPFCGVKYLDEQNDALIAASKTGGPEHG